jgi:hypothetical protein
MMNCPAGTETISPASAVVVQAKLPSPVAPAWLVMGLPPPPVESLPLLPHARSSSAPVTNPARTASVVDAHSFRCARRTFIAPAQRKRRAKRGVLRAPHLYRTNLAASGKRVDQQWL